MNLKTEEIKIEKEPGYTEEELHEINRDKGIDEFKFKRF